MDVTVNGEPVPVTTGSPGVRWNDTSPVTNGELVAFRLLMERTEATLAAEKNRADEAETKLAQVRDLAESWTADDGHGNPTLEMAIQAECGREVLAITGEPPS